MIVVEGPDGAGKTSLIRSLQAMTGLPVAPKAVSPEAGVMVDIAQYIDEALDHARRPMIYDRFALISGPIYGPLMGMLPPNDVFLDGPKLLEWQTRFHLARPLIVYCLPPVGVVNENILNTPQGKHVKRVWKRAYWAYWAKAHTDAVTMAPWNGCCFYDYTTQHPQDVYNWINWRRN